MAETRRKFDQDFKEGAVRLVRETGRPIAQVAKELGINEGTLGKLASVPGLGSDEIAQSGEVCGPDGSCAVPQR